MKKLISILLMAVMMTTAYSCSNTRDTKRADPNASQNEPMRKKNQATNNNTSGHQNDKVRETTR